jgi:orotate phosphoribosyltransferase
MLGFGQIEHHKEVVMHESEVKDILAKASAVITGDHFVYTSEKHGDAYINKDAIYPYVHATSRLCSGIAEHFIDERIEVVVAPAVGAIILSQWVAFHLHRMTGEAPLAVYADKVGKDDFEFKRGYDKLLPTKRVLVVEDLFTTGGSAKKVVEQVRSYGGYAVGVAGLANRGKVTLNQVGNPKKFVCLLDVDMKAYDPAECPLCKQGVPINTRLGHGKNFLAHNPPDGRHI